MRDFNRRRCLSIGGCYAEAGQDADPASESWTNTGSLATARYWHTATLLPNGKVLAAGGYDGNNISASAELYDPASGTWTTTASLAEGRNAHTATLLADGTVLIAGGASASGALDGAELYDVGLGFQGAWRPKITDLKFTRDRRLLLEGARFQGISQASGGTFQDSSTNYPVVQMRSIDSSQVVFLPVDPSQGWSDTSFGSLPLADFPGGPAIATVFTNGIPGKGKYLVIAAPE